MAVIVFHHFISHCKIVSYFFVVIFCHRSEYLDDGSSERCEMHFFYKHNNYKHIQAEIRKNLNITQVYLQAGR